MRESQVAKVAPGSDQNDAQRYRNRLHGHDEISQAAFERPFFWRDQKQ
jgi:hypothetical protein